MRLFKPALILIVLLLGGLICLALRPGSWWPWLSTTISNVVTGQSSAASVRQNPPPVQRDILIKKSSHRSPQHGAAAGLFEPAEPVLPAPVSSKPNAPPRFPVASEIQPGTLRNAILIAYGNPTATVTSNETGHIRERFIYADADTGRRTFIILVDGRVSQTETFPQ